MSGAGVAGLVGCRAGLFCAGAAVTPTPSPAPQGGGEIG